MKCGEVPPDPKDDDVFTCSNCGVKLQYVVLEDGYAEWVDITPPEPVKCNRTIGCVYPLECNQEQRCHW